MWEPWGAGALDIVDSLTNHALSPAHYLWLLLIMSDIWPQQNAKALIGLKNLGKPRSQKVAVVFISV